MKLQTQFLALFSILLAALIASITYNSLHQKSKLEQITAERIDEFRQTFQQIIDLKVSNTRAFLYDYTYWDEMVEFVSTHDPLWAKYNIDETMKTFGADYVYIMDVQGKMIYRAVSEKAKDDILAALDTKDFDFTKPVFSSYFIDVKGTPVQVFIGPIQKSEDIKRIGKPQGYMVTAKIWTPEFIREFTKITKQETHLAHSQNDSYSYIHPLRGRDGKPLFGLGVRLSSTTSELLEEAFQANILSLIVIGLAGIIGFGLFVYRKVIIPLDVISTSMQNGTTASMDHLIQKQGEFGRIAILIKSFFVQKMNLEHQLRRADEAEQEQRKLQSRLENVNADLEEKVQLRTKELEEINQTLEDRVTEETRKRRKQEQMLLQQNRLASMGEMIGNIAHQWRQPLNTLGLIVQDVEDAYDDGDMDQTYIKNMTTKSMEQINFMSRTIDDFRNFFNPNKEKKHFLLSESISNTAEIIGPAMRKLEIDCEITVPEGMMIDGYQNECSQVLFNMINNAKDAFLTHPTSHPKVSIEAQAVAGKAKIKITDNAGGIADEMLPKIFDPYFTTKGEAQGSGLGLYMVKMIIEDHMDGTIEAENINGGMCFTITLNTVPSVEENQYGV